MAIPSELKYTEEHEWVRVEKKDIVTVGITEYATEELGDIVFVDLPEVGAEFEQMSEFGSVESVKTVSNLYLPVSGEITEVNSEVAESPETVTNSPYDDGWLVKVKLADPGELDDLMTADEYKAFIENL